MRDDLYELKTVKQYALLRGVTERTVREWIRRHLLDADRNPGTKGQWRIKVPRARAS